MPPLPWKKAGISRFGASLVETGFSTSLVDLFVKNRDGIKRSSKKRKNRIGPNVTESLAGDSSVGDLLLSSCPASPSKSLISRGSFYRRTPSPLHHHHHPMSPTPAISRNPSRPSFSGSRVPENESFAPVLVQDAVIGGDRKSVRAKKVFVGMLKIVFLLVLALGKKQFAIGITVTAFLLHIMELLGKCMCRLLKQCQEAHFSFRHFLEQVVCNLRSKNEIEPTCSMEEDSSIEDQTDEDEDEQEEEEEEEANSSYPDLSIVNVTPPMDWISRIIMDEIAEEEEQWDSPKNPKNRSRNIKSKIMKLWIPKKKQEEYPISDSDGEEEEQQPPPQVADEISLKNLRKDIKARINKIIPKKLKNSKKKQKYQMKNRSVFYVRFEVETESQAIDNLYDEEESYASSSKPNDDDDQILPFNDNEDSSDSSSDESEMVESPKKEEKMVVCNNQTMWTTKRTSFAFLIPIILIGLEGGRFWAIMFTMICCSVWKLVTMSSKFFQVLVAHI